MTRFVSAWAACLAFASAGCAFARFAPEARVAQGQPASKPGVEYERILGTFAVRTEIPIYLTPRLLDRGYSSEDEETGEQSLLRTVDAFHQLGHPRGEAAARLNHGAVLWQLGRGDDAYRELEAATALFQQAGDLEGEAHAHEWIGFFFKESGEKELAEDHLALAYQMFTRLENEAAAERVLSYGE